MLKLTFRYAEACLTYPSVYSVQRPFGFVFFVGSFIRPSQVWSDGTCVFHVLLFLTVLLFHTIGKVRRCANDNHVDLEKC